MSVILHRVAPRVLGVPPMQRPRRLCGQPPSPSPSAHRAVSSSVSSPSIGAALSRAALLLPTQGVIEKFVHHNPLHSLEHMPFDEALKHYYDAESFTSPSQRMGTVFSTNPRKRCDRAVVELSAAFLDRGAAKWTPQFRKHGFLHFFALLEDLSGEKWRQGSRDAAAMVLRAAPKHRFNSDQLTSLALSIVQSDLDFFGVAPCDHERALFSILAELRGWSGMFNRMAAHPDEAPSGVRVHLADFTAVYTTFLRSSATAKAQQYGWQPTQMPFHQWLDTMPPATPLTHSASASVQGDSSIACDDQNAARREALEARMQRAIRRAIGETPYQPAPSSPRPRLQLLACIDDRECSFRRNLEMEDKEGIQTYGVAGFFGVPFHYTPIDGPGRDLAPEGAPISLSVPERLAREQPSVELERYTHRVWLEARFKLAIENASSSALGGLALASLAPLSLAHLWLSCVAPGAKDRLYSWLSRRFAPKPPTELALGDERDLASRLAKMFNNIGLHQFSPLVVVLGHEASTVNNPYDSAYQCGACSGNSGGPNARLVCTAANNSRVRQYLLEDHQIAVPSDSYFISGTHNTTSDQVHYFEEPLVPESHAALFATTKEQISRAIGRNAYERCTRFFRRPVANEKEAVQYVRNRSLDPGEVRPELNHASNALVVVGRRELTKQAHLDRRAFLPSYDPFGDNASGNNLENVLGPALAVCSGINLEYLMSTISVDSFGAGTKAPLNVVANIGVQQGAAGDLRAGLPSQMTEMHTPLRALFVIDAPVDRVRAVLQRRRDLHQLVFNQWVLCTVRDPITGRFYSVDGHDFALSSPPSLGIGVSSIDGSNINSAIADDSSMFTYQRQIEHASQVARSEDAIYRAGVVGILAACAAPLAYHSQGALLSFPASMAVLSAGLISLPVLSFSHRYLHGEHMYGRFVALSAAMVLSFNLISLAPDLHHALAGWSLFGFSSTFLIGAYNERSSVRDNAIFAFSVYRVSDCALLAAAALAAETSSLEASQGAAACVLLAAALKSSQIPPLLTGLFARSMEGATPTSALGYAGLSAHVGVVLLASTMPLWFQFDWARYALGASGLYTAVFGTIIAKTRPDRKGALAYSTAATIGLINCVLAMGEPSLALYLSLGHTAFRVSQVLHTNDFITQVRSLRAGLGRAPWNSQVPDVLYRLSWRLRRFDTDWLFLNYIDRIVRRLPAPTRPLSKPEQRAWTASAVVLAGAPFTPVSYFFEHSIADMFVAQPALSVALMTTQAAFSVVVVRYLLLRILRQNRKQQ